MTSVAILLSLVLGALALLHLLWAIGLWWPVADERRLVATVVGIAGAERMPGPIPCALVVVAMLSAITWIWLPDGTLRQVGLVLAATVLIIRGFLPWRPVWRRLTPQEPFATLDRRVYGPLCLALGAGFAALAASGV
jgi:hypothetical protein